jgi:Fe-S-cluster containining protein
MSDEIWGDGLRFECARCSHCCRHEPGYVFLSAFDLRRLIAKSGMAFRDYIDTYVKTVDIGVGVSISLREKPNNDCILWEADGCAAYEARPIQCSTYPFWHGIMESKEDWEREACDCPGIGKGPLVPASEIGERLWRRRAFPAIVLGYDVSWETIDENTLLGSSGLASDSDDAR